MNKRILVYQLMIVAFAFCIALNVITNWDYSPIVALDLAITKLLIIFFWFQEILREKHMK